MQVLRLGGIATVADVALNGEHVLRSESMFVSHAIDVEHLLRDAGNELVIRCHALAPILAVPRKPRARWRTRLVDNALRWQRTMLLGRAPGIASSPAAVGPWRPVELVARPGLEDLRLLPRLEGDDGVLEVRARVDGEATVALGGVEAPLRDGRAELRVPGVARWWPHTHGTPVLHDVVVTAAGEEVARRRVGFRTLENADPEALALCVNGVSVFARGAVWTPGDPVGLAAGDATLRELLERVRDAGMNIVRVVGTGAYESAAFHDLCDELGLLVWQDLMFANLDYPVADDGFRALAEREVREQLALVAGRPSLAVVCGNSEVEQQVAMLGLDPELGRGELFGELLPRLAREAGCDVPYVPSAPCGGDLPFRPQTGIAHYFGVGGYRRPLEDARLAEVRFAAECLAFSNLGDPGKHVPGDSGADWDFADVRDHYVRELYGTEPTEALGRQATGEVMAEVFGEWRRAGSPCGGGIVLWLRDREPGAGWGVLDHEGRPKAAYHQLRRALAPLAVWTTDERQGGIAIHVANDGPEPVRARLRLALYADRERPVGEAAEELELAPHSIVSRDAEGLLGRFADVTWAYRFGPPAQDVVVASLEDPAGALLSQAFRFPVGRPVTPEDLGLEARRTETGVELTARRCAYGVRVEAAGCVPADDAFCLEPGRSREVALPGATGPVRVSALNLAGSVEA